MSSKIIISALLTSIIAISGSAAAQANETPSVVTVKPKAGASFAVGARRAISYFTAADTATCKLVLTLADAPSFDDVMTMTTIRFEAAIPSGKATRYHAPDGAALEFACQSDARSMTIRPLSQIVSGTVR